MGRYLGELGDKRRGKPSDGMLSAFVNGPGPDGSFSRPELISTAVLLLIAGHETTVNLITNGMLTLLRNPDAYTVLRESPRTAAQTVEELLRFEPPVQILPQRTPVTDLEVGDVVIPKGAPVW